MKSTRSLFSVVFGMWLVAAGCDRAPTETPAASQPAETLAGPTRELPNIIFIFTDDQAPNTLGYEGNTHIRTPRLDRLAEEGAYFSRAYVPIPQCAPSRAAVLTGLYPHQNGVLSNTDARLKPDAITFPELFKKNGYACGLVGKWHLGNEDRPQCGFEDEWVSFPIPGEYHDPQLYIAGEQVRGDGYMTDILTDHAIDFVDKHLDRPFLLWLAYKAPHGPAVGPGEARFRYDPERIPLPEESMADDLSAKPTPQREGAMHRWFKRADPDSIRRRLSVYYAMMSCVDDNVGRLIDHLKEKDLHRDTLVIYMSDNGFLHGEHRMLTKGPAFYEELVRSPMILWWPGTIEPGTRVDALVSSLDLFPTLCRRAWIPVPGGLAGKDLWPLLSDPSATLHDALFFEYAHKESSNETVPMRGLVTVRHKYVKYLEDGEELYDLRADPHEMKNLIDDPAHRSLADSLRQRLAEWRAETGDAE